MEGIGSAVMDGDVLDLEEFPAQQGGNPDQKLVGRVLTGKVLNTVTVRAIVGRVISAENPFVEGNMLRSFLRVRVEINVQTPLKTGFWLKRDDGSHSWAEFKYEKLYDYCYKCRKIGHDKKACIEELAMSLVNPTSPRYGPELTTPGLRSIENEARKAGIRRRKEEHNNWVEELWEARERSLQGREWLKRQSQREEEGSNQGSIRSSQASAFAKSWGRLANPKEQMGGRQVATQEAQDQDEGADDEEMNGDDDNNILNLADGTTNQKKGEKKKGILEKQQTSESVAMGNVKDVRELGKDGENGKDSNKISRRYIERGGPNRRRMDSTKKMAWAFTNQRPNRDSQQINSGPTEKEKNPTIGQLLKEFNKKMAEEGRKKNIEEKLEEEAQNRKNMEVDEIVSQDQNKGEKPEQNNKQLVTESDGGFYYVELAEEEEELEQENNKAIVVAKEYEIELAQRMEKKLKIKRRRGDDQQGQIGNCLEEEEEAVQVWRASKKNKVVGGLMEGMANEDELLIRGDNLGNLMAEEAGLHMPPNKLELPRACGPRDSF
ncbi:uncharacterized protein LOC130974406 [Arachis stenosperma]|uniref:uncharacterized protein LOC130974406 n=1 Tax=Arachis stenosperma TaxID=217475 RepID=UPI0025AC726F|nr:uncharacterized protein LOC130974406 [Arachis stenosperma]